MGLLNFRIDQSLKDKIDLLKCYYHQYRADLNTSDIVRSLLKQSIGKIELQEPKNFPPDLIVIAQKIDKGLFLSHKELIFLSEQTIECYQEISRPELSCTNHYVIDLLSLLEAGIRMVYLEQGKLNYFIQKLEGFLPDPRDINDKELLVTALSRKKEAIKNTTILSETALCFAEILSVLLRTDGFKNIRKEKWNIIFQPHLRSLYILAKSIHYLSSKYPAYHYPDRIWFESKLFTHNGVNRRKTPGVLKSQYVSIQFFHTIEWEGIINFFDKKHEILKCTMDFTFPMIQELDKLIKQVNQNKQKQREYPGMFFRIQTDGAGNYVLIRGAVRIYLVPEEYDSLQQVLSELNQAYPTAWQRLIEQWGDW